MLLLEAWHGLYREVSRRFIREAYGTMGQVACCWEAGLVEGADHWGHGLRGFISLSRSPFTFFFPVTKTRAPFLHLSFLLCYLCLTTRQRWRFLKREPNTPLLQQAVSVAYCVPEKRKLTKTTRKGRSVSFLLDFGRPPAFTGLFLPLLTHPSL